jgi:hypothetical protein
MTPSVPRRRIPAPRSTQNAEVRAQNGNRKPAHGHPGLSCPRRLRPEREAGTSTGPSRAGRGAQCKLSRRTGIQHFVCGLLWIPASAGMTNSCTCGSCPSCPSSRASRTATSRSPPSPHRPQPATPGPWVRPSQPLPSIPSGQAGLLQNDKQAGCHS